MELPTFLIRARTPLKPVRGFTLVEMIVVLAIMAILTTVVLTGQSTFNESLLLNDTAYTLALSAREAQSLGLSSRKFGTIQNAGYGIYVSSSQKDRYSIFSDISPIAPGSSLSGACPGHAVLTGPEARPGNCLYDSPSTELVQQYIFTRGFTIGKFCGTFSSGTGCSDTNYFQSVDVVFQRPNSNATLIGIHNSQPIILSCLELYVIAPTGNAQRLIKITSAGQIAVGQTCP